MIIAIIPARGGSKRLKRKNLRKVLGKPMIQWAIEACKNTKYLSAVFVSTEDEEIASLAKKLGANVINRPEELAKDNVWTQEVLRHAIDYLKPVLISHGVKEVTGVVRVQANSPQVTGEKIDQCVAKMFNTSNLWEVFTVDKSGLEDGAIHAMNANCVYQNALSVYKGVVETDYIDVHTEEDLRNVEIAMKISNFFDKKDARIEKEIAGFIHYLSIKSKPERENSIKWLNPPDDDPTIYGWRANQSIIDTYKKLLSKSNKKDLQKILSNKDSNELKKVLDLGCGFCPFWPFLEKQGFSEFFGIDLFSLRGEEIKGSNEHLEVTKNFVETFCKSDIKTRVVEGDVRDLANYLDPDEKFDLIFTSNTDYTKKGSTGIPVDLFDEICKKYLSSGGIKIYNG